jgi:hypothetical protein
MHPQGEGISTWIQDYLRKTFAMPAPGIEGPGFAPAIPDVDALSEAGWDDLVEVPGNAEEARERTATCRGRARRRRW